MAEDGEGRQETRVADEPEGAEHEWTVGEYVETVGRRLREHPPDEASTIPVRLTRAREVLEGVLDEEYPKVMVDARWWKRTLAEVERRLREGRQEEQGGEGR